ncbi:MAG: thioredoxin family protein [Promethearchaeota archaeon]
MSKVEKPFLQVLLKEEENYCAKCCKTRQVIERMIDAIPVFKEKVDIEYENIELKENIEKYGNLTPPVVIINGIIFSEGQVPIIKKLSSELFKLVK